MEKKKKKAQKDVKMPCETAFLTNPVASFTDRTGFTPVVPETDAEAESYSELFDEVPVTAHKDESVKDT